MPLQRCFAVASLSEEFDEDIDQLFVIDENVNPKGSSRVAPKTRDRASFTFRGYETYRGGV